MKMNCISLLLFLYRICILSKLEIYDCKANRIFEIFYYENFLIAFKQMKLSLILLDKFGIFPLFMLLSNMADVRMNGDKP